MNAARVYWQLTLEDAFMEKICHQYVIATLFLIFAGLFSGPVLSQVFECPETGCHIITCDGGHCALWYCEGTDCTIVTTWEREVDEIESSAKIDSSESSGHQFHKPSRQKPVESLSGIDCGDQRCAVKVCGPLQCSVLGFDNGQSVLLGSHDNVDAVFDEIGRDFVEGSTGQSVND